MNSAAYEAGREHFRLRGHGGPDMETLWKRHGRIVPRQGSDSEKVTLERDFPARADLWVDHWEFLSWQQGVVDAAGQAHEAYLREQVQPTPTSA